MKALENKIITLRAPEPEDLDFLYQHENDTDFWEISSTITPFSAYILKEYLKNAHKDIFEAKELRLMIVLKKTAATIGMIDLFNYDPIHNRAGVGIMIIEKYRAKGYASQALDLLLEYTFKFLKMKQLYCNIIEGNSESIQLFESKGFKKIGIRKDWINGPDGYKDVGFYQLINSE